MSRLSQRTWSKGSARGAGPAKQVGALRVKDFARVEIREPRCSSDGAPMRRCDDCGVFVCDKPGHLKHRCGLEPEVCAGCWSSYYVGPGEAPHLCKRPAP